MTRRPAADRRLVRSAVAVLLLAGATTGCTAVDPRVPGPSSEPSATSAPVSPTPPAAPTAESLRATAQATTSGLLVAPAQGLTPLASVEAADGSTVLTWTTAGGAVATVAAAAAVHVVAPEGWTFDVLPDRSAVARDGAGVARAALAPPRSVAADGARAPAPVLQTVSDDVLTVALDAGTLGDDAVIGDTEVTLAVSARAVAGADWGDREGGRSLAVVPTDWARDAGEAGLELLWDELVTAEPEVDTAVMHDQLVCHTIGAPDKDAWNLEPWRPDVGLLAVLAAACNPT